MDSEKVRVVVGPPGTGKTTHLANCVRDAVRDRGPDAVMITSLTRTAAAEIVGRDLPLRKESVGTLHAHAYHALGRPELAQTPEALKLWNTEHPDLVLSHGSDFDSPEEMQSHLCGKCDEELSKIFTWRARGVSVVDIPKVEPSLRTVNDKWEKWKRDNELKDFADLVDDAYHDCEYAPGKPEVIYVDECQDHSRAELRLLLSWAEKAEAIVLVGDYDQSLYEWRGADVDGIKTLGVTEKHIRTLSQSWRVPVSVHATATKWINRIKTRFAAEYKPRGHEGFVVRSELQAKDPIGIIEEATRWEAKGKSVMILSACGYMLNSLCCELRRQGVPFHNPYRKKNGRWNPMDRLDRVINFLSGCGSEDAHEPWTWKKIKSWVDIVKSDGVMVRGAKHGVDILADNATTKNMDATDAEVAELFLDGMSPPFGFNDAMAWMRRHVLSSKGHLIDYPSALVRARGPGILEKRPLISVGTIHSVKGGEADIVILLPDISFAAYSCLQSGNCDSITRQFYVGMTRAREGLIIGQGSQANMSVELIS